MVPCHIAVLAGVEEGPEGGINNPRHVIPADEEGDQRGGTGDAGRDVPRDGVVPQVEDLEVDGRRERWHRGRAEERGRDGTGELIIAQVYLLGRGVARGEVHHRCRERARQFVLLEVDLVRQGQSDVNASTSRGRLTHHL